jgi:hypothetical protein
LIEQETAEGTVVELLNKQESNMKSQWLVSSWINFLVFKLSFLFYLSVVVFCQTGSMIPMAGEAAEFEIPGIFAKRRSKGKGHYIHHHHSSPSSSSHHLPPHSHPNITRWTMNVKGETQGQIISFPGSNLDIICFERISLYRLDNSRKIGKANVCVSILRPNTTTNELTFISDTTTFDVIGGSFTSQTTPFVESVDTATSGIFVVSSTTTTSQPRRDNLILNGDGCFTGATGNVRVSGYLEANFTSEVFFFDYIYVVDLNLTVNDGCYFLHQLHE